MKQTLYKIILVLLSIAFSLLICEVTIRCYYHFISNYDYEMWRYARELKQPLPYAELPFHHKPNVNGRYYGVDIKTNSFGLRDREFTVPKPSDRTRIVFLGDSFTLGWGVPFNDTCSKQLEKKLAIEKGTFEVVNMGIGNYNSSMEVELFKRKGLKLSPDTVVLMYYINDTEPTPKISSISYQIQKQSYLLGYLDTRVQQLKMMKKNDDWLLGYYKSIYSADSESKQKNVKAIRELIRLCDDRHIELLIVNIPDLRRLKNYPFSFATDHIRGLAEEAHVPFLDLLPVFDRYEAKSLWVSPDDPHMNSRANSLAAEAIYSTITTFRKSHKHQEQ